MAAAVLYFFGKRLSRFSPRNTDQAKRDYLALQVQGRYRFQPNWTLDGHWTWEIENDGNFIGEQHDGLSFRACMSLLR